MAATTLTSLAKAGGCAAKYSAARLETLLAGWSPRRREDLLVGLDPADDAAVYRLDDERALVFTVDFFPPVVDDPRTFGRIAATNALNDVFAMGGSPLLALSVTAFPEELPLEMLGELLAGARAACEEAGAILAGGHTIRDDEPKYGLAVVGTVHPGRRLGEERRAAGRCALPDEAARDGARPAGATRRCGAPPAALDAAVACDDDLEPRRRRRAPPLLAERRHRRHGLRPSRARLRDGLAVGRADRARGRARCPRSTARSSSRRPASGRAATGGTASSPGRTSRATATAALEALAYDPQTAGGLLVTLPAERVPCSRRRFAAAGLGLWRIGEVVEGTGVALRELRTTRVDAISAGSLVASGPSRLGFLAVALASLVALSVVVTSGAFVRLTASGLGCDNWPRCGDSPFPEQGYHAFIEFGNRVVALIGIVVSAARVARRPARRTGLRRRVRRAALGAFLGDGRRRSRSAASP